MKRRDFIKTGFAGTLGALTLGSASNILGKIGSFSPAPYDLVAVKGGLPDKMFDLAINSLGGMQKFVKKGARVVVKPNIGWDVSPDRAANTNPLLVKRIIEHCLNAGAKEVLVFDNTCDEWSLCYSNSGIERAVKDAGGKIAPGNTEGYYQKVSVKKGKRLTSAKVHEIILSSDVFINVPILKNHSSAKLTMAMKNHMGIVWDRGFWHRNDLHQCIADFSSYRLPDLNILDAYNVMMQHGPRGVGKEDIVKMESLLISTDIVAIDAAGAKLFGLNPADIPYIKTANDMGVGNMNLDKIKINRLKV